MTEKDEKAIARRRYYRERRQMLKSIGRCVDCGEVKEPHLMNQTLCQSCRQKNLTSNRQRMMGKKRKAIKWVPMYTYLLPLDSTNEILVTDYDNEVYTIDKRKGESWEDRLDESVFLAWRDLPPPWKGEIKATGEKKCTS